MELSHEEALEALNVLRSNIVATQSASWSNTTYPLVAILEAAGFERIESTDEQKREHFHCYGGAGGYPGNMRDEINEDHRRFPVPDPINRLKERVRNYLKDPNARNLELLERSVSDV